MGPLSRNRRSTWRRALMLGTCALAVVPLAKTASGAPVAAAPRLRSPVGLVAGGIATAAGSGRRTSDACGTGGLVCSVVDVPLDRSGQVPGTIPLHVETLPAEGTPRGAVFLVAGGPGQGSAEAFDLGDATRASFFRVLFPGYTLVAYDDRGTGRSDPLDCQALDGAAAGADPAQVAADCAAQLGPQAPFYGTRDHADDLDAVREALGFDQVAVLGVSYGTRLALAYAEAYPSHVERLVLDSVEPSGRDIAFSTDVLQAMPATLARYCAGGLCARATPDFAGDVAVVANRLAASPEPGQQLSALTFLGLVLSADVDPGLAAELPAAVHAARVGDSRPLLHVLRIAGAGPGPQGETVSGALYLATVCTDGPFPWQPDATLQDREASLQGAVDALAPGSFGPFGPWAAGLGSARACAGWPAAGAGPPASGTLPDVPVLALAGGLDLRTPVAGAAAVIAGFPHGSLLVVPGVGHSVLTSDPSFCSQTALRTWILTGRTPDPTCPRAKPYLAPLAAYPRPSSARLDPARSRSLAVLTVEEAEAAWLASAGMSGATATVHGIYGGKLVGTTAGFVLQGYRIAPGLSVSGRLTLSRLQPPLGFTGSVRVAGANAAHGTLTLANGKLSGRLGARAKG